jgi:hypothetical protein
VGEQRPLKVSVLELKSSARAVKALGDSRLAGRAVYLQPSGLSFDVAVEIKLPFSRSAAVGNDAPRPARALRCAAGSGA